MNIPSLNVGRTLGDTLRDEQRYKLRELINNVPKGEVKDLLRNIHGDKFELIKSEVPQIIENEIKNTKRYSVRKALEIALRWSQGVCKEKWWLKSRIIK